MRDRMTPEQKQREWGGMDAPKGIHISVNRREQAFDIGYIAEMPTPERAVQNWHLHAPDELRIVARFPSPIDWREFLFVAKPQAESIMARMAEAEAGLLGLSYRGQAFATTPAPLLIVAADKQTGQWFALTELEAETLRFAVGLTPLRVDLDRCGVTPEGDTLNLGGDPAPVTSVLCPDGVVRSVDEANARGKALQQELQGKLGASLEKLRELLDQFEADASGMDEGEDGEGGGDLPPWMH